MGNTRRLLAGGLVMTTTVTLVRPASAQATIFFKPDRAKEIRQSLFLRP
jgi:hypothetical protein